MRRPLHAANLKDEKEIESIVPSANVKTLMRGPSNGVTSVRLALRGGKYTNHDPTNDKIGYRMEVGNPETGILQRSILHQIVTRLKYHREWKAHPK
jgi:hypothetical protein